SCPDPILPTPALPAPSPDTALSRSPSDGLVGLKQNTTLGKLIPAGTGMARYQAIEPYAPDYEPLDFYSSEESGAEYLAGLAAGGGDGSGNGEVIGFPGSAGEGAG